MWCGCDVGQQLPLLTPILAWEPLHAAGAALRGQKSCGGILILYVVGLVSSFKGCLITDSFHAFL